eukprot:scaffold1878_cov64-Phaeocystis_antarctica.AAC.9
MACVPSHRGVKHGRAQVRKYIDERQAIYQACRFTPVKRQLIAPWRLLTRGTRRGTRSGLARAGEHHQAEVEGVVRRVVASTELVEEVRAGHDPHEEEEEDPAHL